MKAIEGYFVCLLSGYYAVKDGFRKF